MGKKKVADGESESESDSESDSDVDDDEDADAKPAALDDGNCSNGSNKSEDEKVDLASVSGSHLEGESSGEKSQSSGSEKDGNALQESMELTIRSGCDEGGMTDQPAPENTSGNGTSENGISALSEEVTKTDVDNTGSATSLLNDPEVPPVEESAAVNNKSLLSEEPVDLTTFSSAAESADPEVPPVKESADVNNKSLLSEEPVDLTTISSAAELEVCCVSYSWYIFIIIVS
jgi:hypothetical protein